MQEYKCNVVVYMLLEEDETEDAARERMFNQLYDGLCNAVDYRMDFQMFDGEAIE